MSPPPVTDCRISLRAPSGGSVAVAGTPKASVDRIAPMFWSVLSRTASIASAEPVGTSRGSLASTWAVISAAISPDRGSSSCAHCCIGLGGALGQRRRRAAGAADGVVRHDVTLT